jgi:hypothetical protein
MTYIISNDTGQIRAQINEAMVLFTLVRLALTYSAPYLMVLGFFPKDKQSAHGANH